MAAQKRSARQRPGRPLAAARAGVQRRAVFACNARASARASRAVSGRRRRRRGRGRAADPAPGKCPSRPPPPSTRRRPAARPPPGRPTRRSCRRCRAVSGAGPELRRGARLLASDLCCPPSLPLKTLGPPHPPPLPPTSAALSRSPIDERYQPPPRARSARAARGARRGGHLPPAPGSDGASEDAADAGRSGGAPTGVAASPGVRPPPPPPRRYAVHDGGGSWPSFGWQKPAASGSTVTCAASRLCLRRRRRRRRRKHALVNGCVGGRGCSQPARDSPALSAKLRTRPLAGS